MILYTMMPQELIFQTESTEFSRHLEINYNGIPLMVERTDDQGYKVIRVLSSNPDHYLDSRFMPGSIISS